MKPCSTRRTYSKADANTVSKLQRHGSLTGHICELQHHGSLTSQVCELQRCGSLTSQVSELLRHGSLTSQVSNSQHSALLKALMFADKKERKLISLSHISGETSALHAKCEAARGGLINQVQDGKFTRAVSFTQDAARICANNNAPILMRHWHRTLVRSRHDNQLCADGKRRPHQPSAVGQVYVSCLIHTGHSAHLRQ